MKGQLIGKHIDSVEELGEVGSGNMDKVSDEMTLGLLVIFAIHCHSTDMSNCLQEPRIVRWHHQAVPRFTFAATDSV